MIAEGLSDVQVRSISNSVEGELMDKAKIEPNRKTSWNRLAWKLDWTRAIINIPKS